MLLGYATSLPLNERLPTGAIYANVSFPYLVNWANLLSQRINYADRWRSSCALHADSGCSASELENLIVRWLFDV